MRVSLSYKLILGSLAVSAVVLVVPHLIERSGVAIAPWFTPFLALAAGCGLGVAISREIGGSYRPLLAMTERIGRGDLSPAPERPVAPRKAWVNAAISMGSPSCVPLPWASM